MSQVSGKIQRTLVAFVPQGLAAPHMDVAACSAALSKLPTVGANVQVARLHMLHTAQPGNFQAVKLCNGLHGCADKVQRSDVGSVCVFVRERERGGDGGHSWSIVALLSTHCLKGSLSLCLLHNFLSCGLIVVTTALM